MQDTNNQAGSKVKSFRKKNIVSISEGSSVLNTILSEVKLNKHHLNTFQEKKALFKLQNSIVSFDKYEDIKSRINKIPHYLSRIPTSFKRHNLYENNQPKIKDKIYSSLYDKINKIYLKIQEDKKLDLFKNDNIPPNTYKKFQTNMFSVSDFANRANIKLLDKEKEFDPFNEHLIKKEKDLKDLKQVNFLNIPEYEELIINLSNHSERLNRLDNKISKIKNKISHIFLDLHRSHFRTSSKDGEFLDSKVNKQDNINLSQRFISNNLKHKKVIKPIRSKLLNSEKLSQLSEKGFEKIDEDKKFINCSLNEEERQIDKIDKNEFKKI